MDWSQHFVAAKAQVDLVGGALIDGQYAIARQHLARAAAELLQVDAWLASTTGAPPPPSTENLIGIARRLADLNDRCNSDLKPYEIGNVVAELDAFEKAYRERQA